MDYSIPEQARKLLVEGILHNPLHQDLPSECQQLEQYVKFVGSDKPSLPINWRFAESLSALKGLEAIMINLLLQKKYHIQPLEVTVNTDHAQLFFMSAFLTEINPEDENAVIKPTSIVDLHKKSEGSFPSADIHNAVGSPYRQSLSTIYKTSDDRFLHCYAGLNPNPTLQALGLPLDMPGEVWSIEKPHPVYAERFNKSTAAELDYLIGERAKQATTTCWTTDEFFKSEHGRANADIGLYKIHYHPNPAQSACWWSGSKATFGKRPLAGLKVLDLTRIIAAPTVTRSLAELGASVMRVTCQKLPDFSGLHPDLNWGKWNCDLDVRDENDCKILDNLLLEADVVVTGYRPHALDKYGFGQEDILKKCSNRANGIIFVRENSFGWSGPWAHRIGWQPISDANCGVAMSFGRAMGNNEPVTPVMPNSDYSTGLSGSCAVLQALLQRAETGGSYTIDLALNYYSAWLVNSVGTYPDAVWKDVWDRNGRVVLRHWQGMDITVPLYLKMLLENSKDTLLRPEFFEVRKSGALDGLRFKTVKPVLQFAGDIVQLGYNVGTRGNGVDQPRWPADLMTEVIA